MANKIYKGNTAIGTPIYTVSGDRIYDGNSAIGTPVYTIS